MKLPWAVAVAVLVPALWADNYPRQPGIDVQHYIFRVALNDANDEIAGQATVKVRFGQPGLTQIALDLASEAKGKGMIVASVTSRGAAVPYVHTANRLRLTFPAPEPGHLREFVITYHGIPADGLKFVRNRYGERCIFSANWPDLAHHWLPVVDHPYDKATGEFVITAPAKYQVVANGRLTEEVDLGDGRRVTHWMQSVPIAAWLYSIGVAQFASRNFGSAAGVPLQTWVFHQDRDAGIATFEAATRRAIEFYADRIGPYPYEKLAAVESAASDGGMEHASAVFYGQSIVNGKPALGLVAHETAHQWFGDSVTESDWDDVWLSEGFATYFAFLATEHYDGRDAFLRELKKSREQIFKTEKHMPGVAVVERRPWSGIPNQIVYQKGAWTLHMLRECVGTETFWTAMREYYRRYRDGNASTSDFRKVIEEVSGRNLDWFFEQWVFRPGSPAVEGGWKYNASAKRIDVELVQTQPGDAFRLPLDIGVDRRITRVEMTGKRQHFEIPAESAPASVTLDPNLWVLMDARFGRR